MNRRQNGIIKKRPTKGAERTTGQRTHYKQKGPGQNIHENKELMLVDNQEGRRKGRCRKSHHKRQCMVKNKIGIRKRKWKNGGKDGGFE